MRHILILAVALIAINAHCESLPDAPVQGTPPETHHTLFTREYKIAFSSNAALRVTDAIVTCHNLTLYHGREYLMPMQNCAGNAAWQLGMIPAQIGTVALLEHYHHHKLARVAAWAFPAVDLPSVIYSLAHAH